MQNVLYKLHYIYYILGKLYKVKLFIVSARADNFQLLQHFFRTVPATDNRTDTNF